MGAKLFHADRHSESNSRFSQFCKCADKRKSCVTFAAIINCFCLVVTAQVNWGVSFVFVLFSSINSINLTWIRCYTESEQSSHDADYLCDLGANFHDLSINDDDI